MNKFLLVLFFVLLSCKGNSQEENKANKIEDLKASFLSKNEAEFLNNFPKTFVVFNDTFGWDEVKNSQEPLYNDANKYIDYWFSLLQKSKYKKYESQIISISKEGKWDADAIEYFRKSAVNYIKKENKYDLINSLNNEDAKSVLNFFYGSPSPIFDAIFFKNLDNEKKIIVKKMLSNNISEDKKRGTFSTYENNNNFFIKTFDVNKDGVLDKIVSNKPYQENTDLFVFYGNKENDYQLVLETINFSEDGGNIIESIYPITNEKGFMVKTYFPDRGYYEKEYYIIPQNNNWILRNIIYKTMSDVSENAVKYICDVKQNIDITKSNWSDKINEIPEENERNKKCRIENNSNENKQYFIQDSDGYTNLRKDKTSTSEILQKIKSGEHIEVLDNTGDWFLIKTKEGKEGYVHKSRIKTE
ncbi:SH3 domain protein [Chryseobacterium taklimakanense]|uniref:SH3 domain protein n=1 Tax=Chryseobacterium taklimakanense TaxID=536441 RepID=A0A239WE58_9FLAO|nr:SH3 domain-containing protein [Chryseobacterium taklimakanense]SNV32213.1 SH3 domain protein [Chryseobacterium taklimakanense]